MHRNFGGGDENSAADFGQFLNHIDVMRHELGAAVVIVHHSGHSKADRSRGSSSIKAAMDHEFCVTVEADKTRLLSCTKMKDAASPEPQRFALRGVVLDLMDAKGQPFQVSSFNFQVSGVALSLSKGFRLIKKAEIGQSPNLRFFIP